MKTNKTPCFDCRGQGIIRCNRCSCSGVIHITMVRDSVCPDCNGQGQWKCDSCSGSGNSKFTQRYKKLNGTWLLEMTARRMYITIDFERGRYFGNIDGQTFWKRLALIDETP